ncbi:Thermostable monoacylglycerol lipase [Roseivivax jejudonensis]|uniref:Thermostable monoacylglycerol lipase n=1 Tax=Roseivivax jejudonensis TaxID=1529041 RepID=A0A1X6ZGC5_9RHOB|nr:alpha/beta fold hydrolase [Roseivivax jejudonensis]SLN50922.1 Thermostable monoacylglycerol lipase [Roseivivax jejudonensis]
MLLVLRWIARIALALVLIVSLMAVLGTRTPRVDPVEFDAETLGADLDAYLAEREAAFDDIVPGTEKRILWAGEPEARTEWAVIYLHGFSATSEEVRPLPDRVAEALGANLFFTRLAGHGRDGAAMAGPRVSDWMADVAEAMAIGRRIGDRVLVIGTSTGGTLATLAAADPDLSRDMAGLALISPNYRVNNPAARILTWPGVRWWGPLVAGEKRGFTPVNDRQARYWTERYPTVAVLPMARSVAAARGLDHATIEVPALFLFADEDQVVDADATRTVAAAWGGPSAMHEVTPGPDADPYAHVLAGDILSPNLTEPLTARIVAWAQALDAPDGD